MFHCALQLLESAQVAVAEREVALAAAQQRFLAQAASAKMSYEVQMAGLQGQLLAARSRAQLAEQALATAAIDASAVAQTIASVSKAGGKGKKEKKGGSKSNDVAFAAGLAVSKIDTATLDHLKAEAQAANSDAMRLQQAMRDLSEALEQQAEDQTAELSATVSKAKAELQQVREAYEARLMELQERLLTAIADKEQQIQAADTLKATLSHELEQQKAATAAAEAAWSKAMQLDLENASAQKKAHDAELLRLQAEAQALQDQAKQAEDKAGLQAIEAIAQQAELQQELDRVKSVFSEMAARQQALAEATLHEAMQEFQAEQAKEAAVIAAAHTEVSFVRG